MSHRRSSRNRRGLAAGIEERTRELAGLLEVTQTVGSTFDLVEILRRVSREVARLLGADMVGAYLADAEARALRPVAGYRVPEALRECFAAYPIPLAGHRFLEEAWESRRPVLASGVAADPRLDPETVRRFPHRSLLFVPLVAQGAPIGGLFALWWERERRFTPAELHLVEGIASQAATAVANARLYEDLTQKNVHLKALFETARRATISLNLADVLPSLVKSAAELIGVDASSIRVLDRSGTWLEAVAHHGLSETFAQRGPVKVGEGMSGRMVLDGLPQVVEDVDQDLRVLHQEEFRAEGLRSVAMVPLRARDRILGTLTVYARAPRHYLPGEIDLLSQFANLAALSIENARLFEDAHRGAQEQVALNMIATATTQSLRLEEVLQIALDKTLEVTGREVGFIRLKDPLTERLQLVAHHGVSASYVAGLSEGEWVGWMAAEVLATGQVRMVNNPTPADLREETWREGIRSMVWIPLNAKGQVVGVLVVASRTAVPFEPREVNLLQAIGNVVGQAVANARLYEETQQRAQEQAMLSAVARTVSQSLRLDELSQVAVDKIVEVTGRERVSIRIKDPVTGQIVLAAHRGIPEDHVAILREGRALSGKAAEAFESGKSLVIHDPEGAVAKASGLRDWVYAIAWVPLKVRGNVVGVLGAATRRAIPFTAREVEFLEAIGNVIGVAIENARLYEEARARLARTKRLAQLSHLVTSSLELKQVLEFVTEATRDLLKGDLVRLWVADEEAGVLQMAAQTHRDDLGAVPVSVRLPLGQGVVGWAMKQKMKHYSPDVLEDPFFHNKEWARAIGLVSLIAVPLLVGERALGALAVLTTAPRRFSQEEEELLELFAAKAATALENAHLYEELKRSYEELARTRDRLVQSEKLRALGEMAGGVAHDFNNLLTPILGRAQYLMLRLAAGEVAPEEIRRSLRIIERAAMDGAETVRRLLGFTRATPRPSEAEVVNVRELFASVAATTEPRWKDEAEGRGARIEVVLDIRGARPVVGNPAELREVLLNLVFNAIDAMPEGGTLTLASWDEEDAVCLAVGDTGVGIPEEIQSRVFDPFFTTKGPQSSGLGLSVSYGIIRRHEGEIAMDSRPGQGTTVTIRLPVREAPPPRVEAAPTPAPRRGLRVLAVDDETEVREVLREILEAAGHEVHEAGSGPEALEILERQAVDLVCTDLGMPGMSGWEVADRIRARWPGVRVALVTGWGARVEPAELQAHGVDFLVAKPFQIEDLLHTLSKLGPVPSA